jgi:hypothetical protein
MPQTTHAGLLFSLIVFESLFMFLFSMYAHRSCSLGLSLPKYTPPAMTGTGAVWVIEAIYNFFWNLGQLLITIVNLLVIIAQLFTGLGLNCGFPTWWFTLFQIPIGITIFYLIVPFVK